jgi:hypothetical protein
MVEAYLLIYLLFSLGWNVEVEAVGHFRFEGLYPPVCNIIILCR